MVTRRRSLRASVQNHLVLALLGIFYGLVIHGFGLRDVAILDLVKILLLITYLAAARSAWVTESLDNATVSGTSMNLSYLAALVAVVLPIVSWSHFLASDQPQDRALVLPETYAPYLQVARAALYLSMAAAYYQVHQQVLSRLGVLEREMRSVASEQVSVT